MNTTLLSSNDAYEQVIQNKQKEETKRREYLHHEMRVYIIRQIEDAVSAGKLVVTVYPSALHKELREELRLANYSVTQHLGSPLCVISWDKT